jgi:DNA-binding GntR family transcriptional regulator
VIDGRVQDDELDPSLAQQAYAELKRQIVALVLPAGSTIHEADLRKQLNVGRTPLRDALQRLTHEGLLRIYPRRAIVVAKLGLPEIRQVFEVRLALEPAAAALAAERRSTAAVDELNAFSTELRQTREQPDATGFLRADQIFHRAIAGYAQNSVLSDYVDHLQTLNFWLWNMYFAVNGVRRADLFAHDPIIAAIRARDAQTAERAMREHIVSSKEQLLAGF